MRGMIFVLSGRKKNKRDELAGQIKYKERGGKLTGYIAGTLKGDGH